MGLKSKTAVAADFQATAEQERSIAIGLEATGRQDEADIHHGAARHFQEKASLTTAHVSRSRIVLGEAVDGDNPVIAWRPKNTLRKPEQVALDASAERKELLLGPNLDVCALAMDAADSIDATEFAGEDARTPTRPRPSAGVRLRQQGDRAQGSGHRHQMDEPQRPNDGHLSRGLAGDSEVAVWKYPDGPGAARLDHGRPDRPGRDLADWRPWRKAGGSGEEMKHDLMHQRGEGRCGAKTRSGQTCQSYTVHGRRRCRMHGGAAGSGAPHGNKNGLKHGWYSREAVLLRQLAKQTARKIEEILDRGALEA